MYNSPTTSGSVPLDEAVLPNPLSSVSLTASVHTAFTERFTSTVPHVAESFHANTVLSPHRSDNIALDERAADEVRRWLSSTAYHTDSEAWDYPSAVAEEFLLPMSEFRDAFGLNPELLFDQATTEYGFSLDFVVYRDDKLYRLVPGSAYLWFESSVAPALRDELLRALPDGKPISGLLFLVAVPWRYMALQGARGYRRTLIDTGRVLRRIEELLPAQTPMWLDFHDASVNEALNLDGVERHVLAVVSLPVPAHPDNQLRAAEGESA